MKDLKKFFTDKRISLIIRWWAAGAVFFFIGWGTNLGQKGIIDYVFVLGLSLGAFNMLVTNPVIRHMLNVKSEVRYIDISIQKQVMYRMGTILQSMLIVLIVAYIYNIINVVIITLGGLSETRVPIPAEPILFGLLYVMIWSLMNSFINSIKKRANESETKK